MDVIKIVKAKPLYQKYWYLIAGAFAAIVVLVFISKYRNVSYLAQEDSLLIETVQRGPLTVSVRGYGKLTARDVYWIGAQVQGQVEHVFVKAGDHLQPGAVLVMLSNPQLQQQLKNAELEYNAQQADLNANRIDFESQLMGLQTDVANAEIDYQLAKMDLDAKTELTSKGGQIISRIEMERATLTVEQYKRRLDIQNQYLLKQTAAIEARKNALSSRLLQAENALANATREVDSLKIRTTVDGIVQEINLASGQNISPNETISRIAQQDNLLAEIQIPELQVNSIQVGMKVVVDTRTSKIDGRVARIDPKVIGGSVQIDVELTGKLPQEVRPDLNIEATIEISHIPDTVFVKRPIYAREYAQAQMFVLNSKGDIAQKVPVHYGQLSSLYAEVVEGLAPGDRVIVSDTSSLEQHEQVLIR